MISPIDSVSGLPCSKVINLAKNSVLEIIKSFQRWINSLFFEGASVAQDFCAKKALLIASDIWASVTIGMLSSTLPSKGFVTSILSLVLLELIHSPLIRHLFV